MNLFPEPKHFSLQGGATTFHHRARVVVQQHSLEDAMALAERLSEEMTVDVESFVALVDDTKGENCGEIVTARILYPLKERMAGIDESAAPTI